MELCHFGILGMRWGVRRYENADGSLTEAGKRRYNREKADNDKKRQKNRKSEAELRDPDRWVREDRTAAKNLADSGAQFTRSALDLERNLQVKKKRMDLASMSDKEMRDRINREYLERQYDDLFNQQKVNMGRERVKEALTIAGSSLGVVSSALGIALSIQALRGK